MKFLPYHQIASGSDDIRRACRSCWTLTHHLNVAIIRPALVKGRHHCTFRSSERGNRYTYATHHPFSLQKGWELRKHRSKLLYVQNLKTFLFAFLILPVRHRPKGTTSSLGVEHFHPLEGFNARRSRGIQICLLGKTVRWIHYYILFLITTTTTMQYHLNYQ
jgi:hypothetical protein